MKTQLEMKGMRMMRFFGYIQSLAYSAFWLSLAYLLFRAAERLQTLTF